jgi:hypothetical protein
MAGFDLTRTARSLLNIEVNTIVRDNMAADQMPTVPHSLLDIAKEYTDEMSRLGIDMPAYFAANADPSVTPPAFIAPPAGFVGASLTNALDTFNRLRWAANWGMISHDPRAAAIPATQRVLLDRIVNNCDAIKEMFKRFDQKLLKFCGQTRAQLVALPIQPNDYTMSPDDLIQLQKIWDIGVEIIVAQTLVHVTGDITTRVQERLARPEWAPLFAIHRQSIDVSVGCWQYLLTALTQIAGAAVSALLGVRK